MFGFGLKAASYSRKRGFWIDLLSLRLENGRAHAFIKAIALVVQNCYPKYLPPLKATIISPMTIEQALSTLKKSDLVKLIIEIYGRDDDIDQTIERYTASTSATKNALRSVVERQLHQIGKDSTFIAYYASGHYAARLQRLLTDIYTLLCEQDPEQALQATEKFIWLHESVLQRADDSDGELGDVFRDAVDQWLDIATHVRKLNPQLQNWVGKVLAFYDGNDYGVLDNIISHSGELLSDDELTQLAWRFEAEAQKALDKQQKAKDTGYNHQAASATLGLRSIAEAKGDVALFESSFLLTSPTPNTLQLEQIIKFAIATKNFDRAAYWLDRPEWQEASSSFKALRNCLLKAQGKTKQLKTHLAEDFYHYPNEISLQNYWEVASETEQKALVKKLPELSKAVRDPDDAISMALFVQHSDLASELLIEHSEQLTELYYSTFLRWLAKLNEKTHPLACIVCYRCLLSDLLNRGYTKAYHHGADYFHKLLKLDKSITDYKNLPNAQSYIQELQEKHGRKRSFWQQANYPNK